MDIKYPIKKEYMICVIQINGFSVRVPRSGPAVGSGQGVGGGGEEDGATNTVAESHEG